MTDKNNFADMLNVLLEKEDDYDGENTEPKEPIEIVPVSYPAVISEGRSLDKETDYQFARSNLLGLIGRINNAVDVALRSAIETENPRALEVIAVLAKTSSSMTEQLTKLTDKEASVPSGAVVNNTQNNFYDSVTKTETEEKSDMDNMLDEIINKKTKTKE